MGISNLGSTYGNKNDGISNKRRCTKNTREFKVKIGHATSSKMGAINAIWCGQSNHKDKLGGAKFCSCTKATKWCLATLMMGFLEVQAALIRSPRTCQWES